MPKRFEMLIDLLTKDNIKTETEPKIKKSIFDD
jgi:hypothetical protein